VCAVSYLCPVYFSSLDTLRLPCLRLTPAPSIAKAVPNLHDERRMNSEKNLRRFLVNLVRRTITGLGSFTASSLRENIVNHVNQALISELKTLLQCVASATAMPTAAVGNWLTNAADFRPICQAVFAAAPPPLFSTPLLYRRNHLLNVGVYPFPFAPFLSVSCSSL